MHLFLNTFSTPANLILYNKNKILVSEKCSLKWEEYNILPGLLDNFIKQYTTYNNLFSITCVCGPGSFTGTRIVCLIINSISYIHNIPLYELDYFTLLKIHSYTPPYFIPINSKEILLQEKNKTSHIYLYNKYQQKGLKKEIDFFLKNTKISPKILSKYQQETKFVSYISPIYAKKPNITY